MKILLAYYLGQWNMYDSAKYNEWLIKKKKRGKNLCFTRQRGAKYVTDMAKNLKSV